MAWESYAGRYLDLDRWAACAEVDVYCRLCNHANHCGDEHHVQAPTVSARHPMKASSGDVHRDRIGCAA